ncbi:MAG: DNA starvation/stationary phase protection protein [Flavobacteriaceae bacterium]|jgi:starvation-inducible DNA-binding protein|nr:DNA starvation/stationary phase protection protein [Flavobacteriaceae bacterium]
MTTKTTHIEANIGISEENKQIVADRLNRLLANEYVLYTKTRKFHWNVEGPLFQTLHALFEDQYNELADIIDEVAERVRKLGHYAIGSLKQFGALADLLEHDGEKAEDAKTLLSELTEDHETIIRIIRNELIPIADQYKDLGTNDLLTGILEQHETAAWKLRATAKE